VKDDTRRGIALMLGACALYSLMWVFVKQAAETIPFLQIMLFRNLVALVPAAAVTMRAGGVHVLRTARPARHIVRALTGLGAMGTNFFALSVLPIADSTALIYTTPLFVTILSAPLLGERVGPWRWSAVLIGFSGIVVIALSMGAFGGPAASGWLGTAAVIAAVSHGLFGAMNTLLVRQLSATDHTAGIVVWQSALMAAFCLVPAGLVWVDPSPWAWLMLLAVGVLGGAAQVLLTEAYASAEASALGPFSYVSIVFTAFAGYAIWGDVPAPGFFLGAALIVAAGLLILHRERVRAARRQGSDAKG
jgi:drug/metabolite transporter (DMT)-like permease